MSIYLDNSATTPVRQEVIDAMLPYLQQGWGNASSQHAIGQTAKKALDKAREQVATLLNCQAEEIWFSACGTNSNNVALLGRARFAEANNLGKHLITSQIEHPSVIGPAQYLEGQGWKVTYLPVNKEGFVEIDELKKAISPQTSIISIMWANNEIGTVQAIEEMAQIAHEREIYFHTDAVQMPGKLTIDLKKIPVSTLSLSGHKFHAPKGIGIFFIRQGINVMPIEFGGGQERGLFPGTEGIPNIVAIGKAAELAHLELAESQKKLRELQERLLKSLSTLPNIKYTGAKDPNKRLPGHISLVVPGVEGESLVMRSDLKDLCVSSGSACHKGIIEPSSILKAIGLSNHDAMGSLRISFSKFNTMEECESAGDRLTKIIADKVK